jgi:hypothetical protein
MTRVIWRLASLGFVLCTVLITARTAMAQEIKLSH